MGHSSYKSTIISFFLFEMQGIADKSKKSTSFLLTLNQPDRFETLKTYLLSLQSLKYAIAGRERAPTTGHFHVHIFVQFTNSIRLSLRRIEGAHIDKTYGTPQQNRRYVKKGEVIWEYGEMKRKGFYTIKEVKEMSAQEREELPITFYNILTKLETKESNKLFVNNTKKNVKVYYISGSSGIGKTTFAKYLIGNEAFNLVKYEHPFWIGPSTNIRIALYDDWRDSHMKASEFLNFIDYNKQLMNVKGGFILNCYEVIIITSIIRFADIYKNVVDESRYQWERRTTEIYLSVVYNDERRKNIEALFSILIRYIKIYILKLLKINK